MKRNRGNPFWVGFSDLMTSLFFIMLVLYIITFVVLQNKIKENEGINESLKRLLVENQTSYDTLKKLLEEKKVLLKVYNTVQSNLKTFNDDQLFKYEEEHKRFLLAFDVYFREGKYSIIESNTLLNEVTTKRKIMEVGKSLQNKVNELTRLKKSDPAYKNISYLLVITGSASNLPGDSIYENYILSYKRAYHLYRYWKGEGIDFDEDKYHDIIDLQISGVGEGGIGRFPRESKNNYESERKNQRFIINIVPKIGEIESE